MLLPVRVERGERVLPAPDDEHPDEHAPRPPRPSAFRHPEQPPHRSSFQRLPLGLGSRASARPHCKHGAPDRLAQRPAGRSLAARSGTARTVQRRARPSARLRRASRLRSRAPAASRSRSRSARRDTRACRGRGRSGERASRGAGAARGIRRPGRAARAQTGLPRKCGNQSQACSEGSRKISANGFVATTSRATTARPSNAAVVPASSSVAETGRRGSKPCADDRPSRAPLRKASPTRPTTGHSSPERRPGAAGQPAPSARRRAARKLEQHARPRARTRAGCGSSAAPA